MAYQPIESHGIIGDLHTVALVGSNGTIDWLCLPRFDAPSVLAAMLDDKKGGWFQIRPVGEDITEKQLYWPETNVLVTRFLSAEGVTELIDYMPVGGIEGAYKPHQVVRRLDVVRGAMHFRLECFPSFDYGRGSHTAEIRENGAAFLSSGMNLGLATDIELALENGSVPGGPGAVSEFQLRECDTATTSLPEGVGGERNWDYRYTWIRDAAFTVYGLMRIGFTEEARRFMEWIEARCHELNEDGSLQIMYGIDGRHELAEETLDHLDGYRGSRPVRVGNGAYDQLQLDIYGELLDSVYLFNKHGEPISFDFWQQLRKLVDWIAENWRKTDEGVWEVRGGQRHFTYSKLMAWVALDRGIRLAEKRSFPADKGHWTAVRDEIYNEIMEEGYSEERNAFVQSYGSDTLDASNLMMPLVFFVSPTDPRMLSTLEETLKSPDGLAGEEGTFNICSFWLVEALSRAGRHDKKRLEDARLMFEKMLGYANHVGIYAEETGHSGEALGNFPQAFTRLALISAAYNLDRTLGH